MYNQTPNNHLLYAVIALAVPLMALLIAVVKSSSVWRRYLAGRPWWQKAAAVSAFLVAVLIGGDKPGPVVPPQDIIEILTMRGDGTLRDISGQVVSGVQARAVQSYIESSGDLVDAADAIIDQARIDTIALTNQLLSADYDIAYFSLDLPRGTPAETNHNIMISFQRVEQATNTLDALVWFSEMPTTNVNVHVEYSISEGVWASLQLVTAFWPATEMIDGVECVRYRYAIPAGVVGTPLKPKYEVTFGGYQPGQYLGVPEEGVVVSVGEVDHLPYTGWDDYSAGEETLLVRYVGGIAVEANYNGIIITGVN